MARGRPKKKVANKIVKKETVDERAEVIKRLSADPKLPNIEEYELGGRDVLRYAGEFEAEHREEMAKFGIGMAGLMTVQKNKHDDWQQG